MGRKAVEKERKPLSEKQKVWLGKLLPYFYEHGMQGPTMDDISSYLGLSKATIYNYYSSKDELVHDALWFKLVDLERFRDILFDEELDFIERYYEGVKFFTESLNGMSALYLNDLKVFFPNSWASVNLFREKSVENIKRYYELGITKEVFKPFNTDLAAATDLIFFDMMIDAKFLIQNRLRVNEAFEEYFNIKFNGILNK